MAATAIDPKALEDAMLKAFPTLFPHLLGTTSSPRVEFYNKFQREADEHDNDFVKKCGGDLDTTLIFAGLFSAVASAFILAVQIQLQPDYGQMSYAVLTIMANATLPNTAPTKIPVTDQVTSSLSWHGPDPTIVHVQAALLSSLAASLLAALVAMLGKQWLNRYSRVDMHGSLIARSRDRQRKMDGMATWHFDLVMESLPLMLQVALLLLGYALSNYLFTIDSVVAGVAVGFTSFGLLFYLLIVSAATLSYNCPFQTPFSLIIHFLIRLDDEHRKYLKRSRRLLRRIFCQEKKQLWPRPGGPGGLGGSDVADGNNTGDHIALAMASPTDHLRKMFGNEIDWEGCVLDSNCIAWMFDMSMDEDVILDIMKFIPEVFWHDGIRTTPLGRLYDTVLECFDSSSGRPVVISKLKNKAYFSAKAFLHLAIQRKCIGHDLDAAVFQSISDRHQIIAGSKNCGGDSDLESTLDMIDRVVKDGDPEYLKRLEPMRWQNFTFSDPHHAWMGHILLYRALYVLEKGNPLPDDVRQFVLHSLRREPPPPTQIVTDCLLIVSLVLGIRLQRDDQQVIDKSHKTHSHIDRIYEKLVKTFRNANSTTDEIDRALEAMKLIAPFSENYISTKSYHLFRVVMRAPVSPAYSEEKKWEASRLALHGAYKWDKALPWVEDPQDILTFLNHHFELATRGENQDEPIQNALRALAYASSDVTNVELKRFDPTKPSFVRGICRVYRNDKPLQLRKAALFFLPLIGDRWFNTRDPIMEPDEMKTLCVDWASAVDDIGHTYYIQKAALAVFFGMMNSPHWRPHIVKDKWKLLEYFTSVPDDSQPLRRCLHNQQLIDAISKVENADAIVLWSVILWVKYGELASQVQQQLKEVTKERRLNIDTMYLPTVESELRKAEDGLTQYNTWSVEPAAAALRNKIESHQQARTTLLAIKRGER